MNNQTKLRRWTKRRQTVSNSIPQSLIEARRQTELQLVKPGQLYPPKTLAFFTGHTPQFCRRLLHTGAVGKLVASASGKRWLVRGIDLLKYLHKAPALVAKDGGPNAMMDEIKDD